MHLSYVVVLRRLGLAALPPWWLVVDYAAVLGKVRSGVFPEQSMYLGTLYSVPYHSITAQVRTSGAE